MNIEQTILGYLRIATVSPKVYPGEVKKNLGIHKQSILELLDKDPGIKLIVFPELSLTGYTSYYRFNSKYSGGNLRVNRICKNIKWPCCYFWSSNYWGREL